MQLSWDRATFNKLHEVKPVLGKNSIYRSLRREEVVLTRLRIGILDSHILIYSNEKISHFVSAVTNFYGETLSDLLH